MDKEGKSTLNKRNGHGTKKRNGHWTKWNEHWTKKNWTLTKTKQPLMHFLGHNEEKKRNGHCAEKKEWTLSKINAQRA